MDTPQAEAGSVEPVDVLDSGGAGGTSIRGGAIRVGGYAGGLLLSLVSAPLLIRHLGLDAFGRYTAAMAVVALTAGLTEFGLRDAVTREYATMERPARDEHMASAIGVRILLSVAGIVVAGGFALAAGYTGTVVIGVLLAAAGQLFNTLQVVLAVPLAVQLRLVTLTALDFLQQVVNVALIVILVVAGARIGAFLDVQFVITLPSLLITAWLVRTTIPLRPRFHAGHWRRVLIATLPFTAISIVAVLYLRISVIFMSIVSTTLQTGYFSTSYRVVTALVYIPSVLVAAAFPILSRAARDDAERFVFAVRRMFDVSLVAGVALGLALAIGAPFVADVLTAHHRAAVVSVLRIHSVVLPCSFLIALGGYALLSSHRHRAVLISIGLGLVINAALLAALVPSDGANGAAIAGSAGEATIAAIMTVMLLRTTEAKASLRSVAAVAVGAGLAVLVALVSGLPAVPNTALAMVVFAAVILPAGAVPRALLDAFSRR